MPVPVQTPSKEYTANGITTAFPLEFDCDKAEYLIVTLDGNEAPVGSWSLLSNTVTFIAAPVNGTVVLLERNTPFQRTTNYQSYDNSFRPTPVNKDFDLIWWKLQELGYRDQVIWLALVKEISDRINGDENLQTQIDAIDTWLENLQENVNQNTDDIAQLVTDLSKEIADRITGDQILKDMFLSMIDEAINEGTINALAITHVDSLAALEAISNVWDGRTVYVKDLGNYEYDALTTSWIKAYQDSDNVIYGAKTQKQINDSLLGDNGASVVNLHFSEIANSIKKSLYDVVYDAVIDVTWFGANGNWNKETQTGSNSTTAVQNAIAYLATLGTRRQGGKRGLKFPKGSYRVDSITLPTSLGFGLDIIGDGAKTTNIYFDHTSTNPAINSEIEFVQFRNISLIGSLDESWLTTRTPFYKGRLPDGRADIDVKFFNCEFTAWNTVAQVHGRGCVFESCSLGLVLCGLDIVVEDYTHGPDTDLMQSKFATMRHYAFRNCRFDNCSRGYKVSGSGEMIDYINDLLWVNNDATNMDILIEAPNAQFVNSFIGNSTYLGSFATSAIKAKALHMSSVTGNISTKSTNYNAAPTSNLNSTEFFVDLSAPCSNLNINCNVVRGIRGAFYRNTSASASKSVSICGNNLPEFGVWKGGNSAVSFILSNANHLNFMVKDNNFSCSSVSGTFYLCNALGNQQAKDIIAKDNTAPFTWADRIFSSNPTIYVNNTATTGTALIRVHQYTTDGDYVVGHLYYAGTVPESSGAVSISLPVPAIALASAFGTIPSGSAKIISATGVSSVGFVFADALINASTQRIDLRKQKDMTLSSIDGVDIPASVSLCIEYKYRFK